MNELNPTTTAGDVAPAVVGVAGRCPGCSASTNLTQYACPACWRRLPAAYRGAITRAWTQRRQHRAGASSAHQAAKAAAGRWFSSHPAAPVSPGGRKLAGDSR